MALLTDITNSAYWGGKLAYATETTVDPAVTGGGQIGFDTSAARHYVYRLTSVNGVTPDTFQAPPGLTAAMWDPRAKDDEDHLIYVTWSSATGLVTLRHSANTAADGYLHCFYGGAVIHF